MAKIHSGYKRSRGNNDNALADILISLKDINEIKKLRVENKELKEQLKNMEVEEQLLNNNVTESNKKVLKLEATVLHMLQTATNMKNNIIFRDSLINDLLWMVDHNIINIDNTIPNKTKIISTYNKLKNYKACEYYIKQCNYIYKN